MVDAGVVAAKLADLADRVAQIRRHRRTDEAELATDRDSLDLVAFNLMLAVQICADVAAHIIADEGWPVAKNLAQSFGRLHEHGVLEAGTAHAMGRAVGLRNVVAHGYAGVDVAMVHDASTTGVADLEAFARQVAAWVGGRPASE